MASSASARPAATSSNSGVNLATTPGKVVFRNDLIELMQYDADDRAGLQAPAADHAAVDQQILHSRPQSREKLHPLGGRQGLTVFIISWVNPDARHADKDFEAYMREGVFAALERSRKSPAKSRSPLSAIASAARCSPRRSPIWRPSGDDRIDSATLFTTQVDFSERRRSENFRRRGADQGNRKEMAVAGYLEGRSMANAFNMLRPNDTDLVLCRQQLPQRHRADGLRLADLELRCDPHAAGQSFLLPAQLLSRKPLRQEAR